MKEKRDHTWKTEPYFYLSHCIRRPVVKLLENISAMPSTFKAPAKKHNEKF
jgi:hypothetical protein